MTEFVQADLHPGNMIVRLEVHKGRVQHKLVLCDAGLVGTMNAAATANFIELFHAVLRGDGHAAGLQMVQHAPRHECTDPEGPRVFPPPCAMLFMLTPLQLLRAASRASSTASCPADFSSNLYPFPAF